MDNLVLTSQFKIVLDDDGMKKIYNTIEQSFDDNPVDIIVIDSRRSLLSTKIDGNEDENSAIFLLQQRLKSLRDKLNKEAGIILVRNTETIDNEQFAKGLLQFKGDSNLRKIL